MAVAAFGITAVPGVQQHRPILTYYTKLCLKHTHFLLPRIYYARGDLLLKHKRFFLPPFSVPDEVRGHKLGTLDRFSALAHVSLLFSEAASASWRKLEIPTECPVIFQQIPPTARAVPCRRDGDGILFPRLYKSSFTRLKKLSLYLLPQTASLAAAARKPASHLPAKLEAVSGTARGQTPRSSTAEVCRAHTYVIPHGRTVSSLLNPVCNSILLPFIPTELRYTFGQSFK